MQDPFAQSVAVLHELIAGSSTLFDALTRIANLAVSAVGGTMAGVTLHDDAGRPITVAHTDHRVTIIDAAQYDADDGPCLDACRSMELRRIDDVDKDDRWPLFRREAARHGVRSSFSVPLIVADQGVGALNMYGTQTGQFSAPSSAHVGELFGAQAAIAASYAQNADLAANLGVALASRAAIEQATGIIMHSVGCAPDGAREILRTQSQLEGITVHELAVRLVTQQDRRGDR